MRSIELKILDARVGDAFPLPHYATDGSAGLDMRACIDEPLTVSPGDTVMGMDLGAGGHLTHGSPVNFSGKLFNIVPYGIDNDTGLIDYDEVASRARKVRPRAIIAGASAGAAYVSAHIAVQ